MEIEPQNKKQNNNSIDTSLMNAKQIAKYSREQMKNAKSKNLTELQHQWEAVYYDTQHDPTLKAYTQDVKHGSYAQRVNFKLPKLMNEDLDTLSRKTANHQILIDGRPHSRKQEINDVKEMANVYKSMLPNTNSADIKKKYQQREDVIKALKSHKKLSISQKALVQRASIIKDSVRKMQATTPKSVQQQRTKKAVSQLSKLQHVQKVQKQPSKQKTVTQSTAHQKQLADLQKQLNNQSLS